MCFYFTGGANSYFHRQRGSRVRMESVTKHEFFDPVDFDVYATQFNTAEAEGEANNINNYDNNEGAVSEASAGEEQSGADGYVNVAVEEDEGEEEEETLSGFDLVNKLLKRP